MELKRDVGSVVVDAASLVIAVGRDPQLRGCHRLPCRCQWSGGWNGRFR